MSTSNTVLYTHPDLGRIFVPKTLLTSMSYLNRPVKRVDMREIGIFVSTQKRPVYNADGAIERLELIWADISHNERVDVGAAIQANLVWGTSGTSANGVITSVAVGNATLAGKAKADLSLASTSANVTTNEFTTIGLSRATGTVSTYTAPSALGAVFSQLITKSFSVSGSGTAWGAGLFDSNTVSGSHLYVEDNFSSTAVLINGDTLQVQITISN